MENLIGSTTGLIHLIASCLSLVLGAMVIIMKKGTALHIKIGYAYVASMFVLIATAFMIYRLFNGWGIFHYFNLLSLVTLIGGMVPIWLKKPTNGWKALHFSFMFWSVMGLYAAFAAEILTRIPETPFISMVGFATGGIMLCGYVIFALKKKKWEQAFATA